MKEVASKAMYEHHNQYPSLLGIPELRQAVARHSEAQQGIPVDWETEALVTVGATEGIAAVFMGLLNPGDEVRVCDRAQCTEMHCIGQFTGIDRHWRGIACYHTACLGAGRTFRERPINMYLPHPKSLIGHHL